MRTDPLWNRRPQGVRKSRAGSLAGGGQSTLPRFAAAAGARNLETGSRSRRIRSPSRRRCAAQELLVLHFEYAWAAARRVGGSRDRSQLYDLRGPRAGAASGADHPRSGNLACRSRVRAQPTPESGVGAPRKRTLQRFRSRRSVALGFKSASPFHRCRGPYLSLLRSQQSANPYFHHHRVDSRRATQTAGWPNAARRCCGARWGLSGAGTALSSLR